MYPADDKAVKDVKSPCMCLKSLRPGWELDWRLKMKKALIKMQIFLVYFKALYCLIMILDLM